MDAVDVGRFSTQNNGAMCKEEEQGNSGETRNTVVGNKGKEDIDFIIFIMLKVSDYS